MRSFSDVTILTILSIVEPSNKCVAASTELKTFKVLLEELQDEIVRIHAFLARVWENTEAGESWMRNLKKSRSIHGKKKTTLTTLTFADRATRGMLR